MPKLTKKDIEYVAKLSNLTLTESEFEKFTPQLSKVVDFISELSEVDTSGVSPTIQTTKLVNVFRNDEINQSSILDVDNALSQAAETAKGLFKVPAILSQRTDK